MTVLEDLENLEKRLTDRMAELRPAIEEYRELEAAAQRLGIDVDKISKRSTRGSRRRTSASAAKPARKPATRRSKPSGRRSQRRDQMLELITKRPGITVPEIATEIGVDPTGLYRIVRQLESSGSIKKDGMALRLA